jgi:hypothetical protein
MELLALVVTVMEASCAEEGALLTCRSKVHEPPLARVEGQLLLTMAVFAELVTMLERGNTLAVFGLESVKRKVLVLGLPTEQPTCSTAARVTFMEQFGEAVVVTLLVLK